jgi:hypothetical protein
LTSRRLSAGDSLATVPASTNNGPSNFCFCDRTPQHASAAATDNNQCLNTHRTDRQSDLLGYSDAGVASLWYACRRALQLNQKGDLSRALLRARAPAMARLQRWDT